MKVTSAIVAGSVGAGALVALTAVSWLSASVIVRVVLVLLLGTVVVTSVSWYLSTRRLSFAQVLLTIYVARIVSGVLIAAIARESIWDAIIATATLGVSQLAAGLDGLPGFLVPLLWLVLASGAGFALGRHHLASRLEAV